MTRRVESRPAQQAQSGFLANGWLAAGIVIGMFALVLIMRSQFPNPGDGVGMLTCIPIALAAVRFGPWVGVFAGMVGWSLFVVWALSGQHDIGAIGYISRATIVLLLGGGIGHFARARDELDVRSRLLFDVSPDLMGTLSLDGARLVVNDAWTRYAQRVSSTRSAISVLLAEFPNAGQSAVVERTAQLRDEAVDIEWHLQRDLHRPLIYAVGRDVTERNAHTEHIRELLAALQSARVDERNRIASELHDFVLQQLLVALMHVESDPELARTDERIRSAVGALRRVIDGIQPLDLEFLDLGQALDRAVRVVSNEWDVEIDDHIDTDARVPEVRKMLAHRLAGEALRNAAKHSGADTIRIDVRDGEGGEFVEISVQDDGCGVDGGLDVSDRIVQQFGTGFNLLVEQLLADGGSFALLSTPGLGTTVTFQLRVRSKAASLAR